MTSLRNEKGIAVPLVAVAMLALLGLAAVGISTGLLATVADEAQNAADVAALSGASAIANDEDPRTAALDVLKQNSIRGGTVGGSNLTVLQTGNYTPGTGFVSGLPPINAVRSVVQFNNKGLLTNAVNMPASDVKKTAIAILSGTGRRRPELPIALGACHFDPECTESDCMPRLRLNNSTSDNAGWTSFFSGATSTTAVLAYMASACTKLITATIPELEPNVTMINMKDGVDTPLLTAVQCLLDQGDNEFVIPIVACTPGGSFNQTMTVAGFATVVVDGVTLIGNSKGVDLHAISTTTTGPEGGGMFGTYIVRLVS